MRFSRLRKFKSKNSRFLLISKLVVIWYLLLLSAVYFTSDTTAHFTDRLKANGGMSIGAWEVPDNGIWKLAFTDKGNQNWDSCEMLTIKTKIKNTGDGDMETESTYEVYYIENGNPKKHGEKMKLKEGEGIIKALKNGEETELTFDAELPGRYVFKAFQNSEHPDETEIWSKEIKVDCGSGQNPEKQKEEKETDEKEKSKQNESVTEENVTETEESESSNEKESEKAEEAAEETKEQEIEKEKAAEEKAAEEKAAEQKAKESQVNKEKETETKETKTKQEAAEETANNAEANSDGEGEGK